jgi:hypothetical protein
MARAMVECGTSLLHTPRCTTVPTLLSSITLELVPNSNAFAPELVNIYLFRCTGILTIVYLLWNPLYPFQKKRKYDFDSKHKRQRPLEKVYI